MRGPGAFDAAGHGVAADAAAGVVHPAQALLFDVGTFRVRAEVRGIAIAVGLADGVAAGGQGHGLLVVHRHAGEGHAHVVRRLQRVGLAVHAFRVHVDQAHQHGGQRVFQVALAGVRLFGLPLGASHSFSEPQ